MYCFDLIIKQKCRRKKTDTFMILYTGANEISGNEKCVSLQKFDLCIV